MEILYNSLSGEAWVENSTSASAYEDGLPQLDWIIAGGESGNKARPSHPDWFRQLRDQCASADVAFFFKQWGSWKAIDQFEKGFRIDGAHAVIDRDGKCLRDHDIADPPHAVFTFKVGKKEAGRTLDGVEHLAFPSFTSPPAGEDTQAARGAADRLADVGEG